MFVYEKLLVQSLTAFPYMNVNILREDVIYISYFKKKQACIETIIIPILVEMFSQLKEKKIMAKILEEKFFYTEEIERNQIISIAQEMFSHEFRKNKKKMRKALLKFFTELPQSFSFDAFLQFRIKTYGSNLLQVVEYAIDEYKLEQDYQNYVNELQQKMKESVETLPMIHFFHSDIFEVYTHEKQLIAVYTEKDEIINKVVQIGPKEIFLYTEYLDHPIIVTMLNVFQERIHIYRVEEFAPM
jgi:putative sporulation protein YtxC